MENNKPTELIKAKVENILVWDKNPRFDINFSTNFDVTYENDDEQIRKMFMLEKSQTEEDEVEMKYFKELLDSLLQKGFESDNDPIFIKQSKTYPNKYFVLEGNRRICALKTIIKFIKNPENPESLWYSKLFGDKYWESFLKKNQN